MPPSIIAVDARNLSHHVYSARRRFPELVDEITTSSSGSWSSSNNNPAIPAVIESSYSTAIRTRSSIIVHPMAIIKSSKAPQARSLSSKKQSLSVSIHMPIPLTREDDSSGGTFHSLDGLSNSYWLLRGELRQKLEPRYNSLLHNKRNIRKNQQQVMEELSQLKRRLKRTSHSGKGKSVRFCTPEVTEIHHRPYTLTSEISKLFFQEEELYQFEQDRSRDPGDIVECAFVEEAYAISVAYQRRISVDD